MKNLLKKIGLFLLRKKISEIRAIRSNYMRQQMNGKGKIDLAGEVVGLGIALSVLER